MSTPRPAACQPHTRGRDGKKRRQRHLTDALRPWEARQRQLGFSFTAPLESHLFKSYNHRGVEQKNLSFLASWVIKVPKTMFPVPRQRPLPTPPPSSELTKQPKNKDHLEGKAGDRRGEATFAVPLCPIPTVTLHTPHAGPQSARHFRRSQIIAHQLLSKTKRPELALSLLSPPKLFMKEKKKKLSLQVEKAFFKSSYPH